MKLKIVIHNTEEGGYWAEVPAIPGCAGQGQTLDELLENVREAIEGRFSEGRFSVDIKRAEEDPRRRPARTV